MEISVYDIHYIASKYLNLRQHVYIVSDWLVFFCSFLCCQCGQYFAQDMPMDGLSEASSVMYQINPRKFEVDTTQSDEELLKLWLEEETAESTGNLLKCTELWSLVDKPWELEGKVEPDNSFERNFTRITDSLCLDKKLSPVGIRSNDFPTVHSHKIIHEQRETSVS